MTNDLTGHDINDPATFGFRRENDGGYLCSIHGSPLVVRELDSVPAIKDYLPIAARSWGFSQVETPSPLDCLSTGRKGGLVMGVDFDGERVGFLYVLATIDQDGRGYHHSHMFCLLPPCRNRGIGHRIKLLYMSLALSRGIDKFSLTVDPLLFNNRLNIGGLGGVGESFLINVYGDFSCDYYGQTDTDRIEVVTRIDSPRVRARIAGKVDFPTEDELLADRRVGLVNRPVDGPDGVMLPGEVKLSRKEKFLAVLIPPDYEAVRDSRDPSGAPAAMHAWREASRAIFDTYLDRRGRDYLAAEFVSDPTTDGSGRNLYLLVPRAQFSWDSPDSFPTRT